MKVFNDRFYTDILIQIRSPACNPTEQEVELSVIRSPQVMITPVRLQESGPPARTEEVMVEKLIEPEDLADTETGGKQNKEFKLEEDELDASVCFSGSIK